MKITMNGKTIEAAAGTRIMDLIEGDQHQYQAARVDNRIRELNYILPSDATVELLSLKDREAQSMYQATLRYLIIRAVKRVYPTARIIFTFSVSRAIAATIANFNRPFLQSEIRFTPALPISPSKIATSHKL